MAAAFRFPRRFLSLVKLPPAIVLFVFYAPTSLGLDLLHGFASLGIWKFVFMIVTFLSTDLVDRLVQRGVSRLLGYDISFFTVFDAFVIGTYTGAPGQLQTRRNVLLIAVAPLGLFLLLLLPLFLGLSGVIGDMLFFFLLMNIAGTGWDLYFVWWLLRIPKGTLIYTETLRTRRTFERDQPANVQAETAVSSRETTTQKKDADLLAMANIGGIGAGWVTRFLPTDISRFFLDVASYPDTGSFSDHPPADTQEILQQDALHMSLIAALARDVLEREGVLYESEETASTLVAQGMIGAGVWDMNPALVKVFIPATSHQRMRITIEGQAKEGPVKQHASKGAAQRVAEQLSSQLRELHYSVSPITDQVDGDTEKQA